MNGWRRDRYKNLKLAYKLTLSSTSKIKKRSTNIFYTIMDTGPCQTLKTDVIWVPFHMTMFNFEKLLIGRLTEYGKKKVTNAYVCRLSLSLTWGWHSVSRRQCYDLKNKTTVLVITYNQLIRLIIISATIYTNLLLLW
jgi:hypothetical protein